MGPRRATMTTAKPWKRVVLKLSGEAFASTASDETIDSSVVERIAIELAEARQELGTEVAVVVGGGNIWRGATGENSGMDRTTADYTRVETFRCHRHNRPRRPEKTSRKTSVRDSCSPASIIAPQTTP